MDTFCEVMRDVFKDATQQELAYVLGISDKTVSKYMNGKRHPGKETFAKMMELTNQKERLLAAYNNSGEITERRKNTREIKIYASYDINTNEMRVYKSLLRAKQDGGEIHKAKWVKDKLVIGEII